MSLDAPTEILEEAEAKNRYEVIDNHKQFNFTKASKKKIPNCYKIFNQYQEYFEIKEDENELVIQPKINKRNNRLVLDNIQLETVKKGMNPANDKTFDVTLEIEIKGELPIKKENGKYRVDTNREQTLKLYYIVYNAYNY